MINAIKAAVGRLFCGNSKETEAVMTTENKNATPVVVTDATFEQLVLKADLPVVVDFYAGWCGPCQKMAPKMEELARRFDGKLVIAKVDTEANRSWAQKFEVKKIPTLIFFNKGKAIKRETGNQDIEVLKKLCDSHSNS
jgi:thioredoxin 1